MKELTILSKNNCVRCVFVERWLKKRRISYNLRKLEDMEKHEVDSLKAVGLLTAPIIIFGEERSAGADMAFLERVEQEIRQDSHRKLTEKNP